MWLVGWLIYLALTMKELLYVMPLLAHVLFLACGLAGSVR